MLKRTHSILTELDVYGLHRDKELFLESKARHLIHGIVNLIEFIRNNYDFQQAEELEKRLINSVRTGDSEKFVRGLKKINRTKINTLSDK